MYSTGMVCQVDLNSSKAKRCKKWALPYKKKHGTACHPHPALHLPRVVHPAVRRIHGAPRPGQLRRHQTAGGQQAQDEAGVQELPPGLEAPAKPERLLHPPHGAILTVVGYQPGVWMVWLNDLRVWVLKGGWNFRRGFGYKLCMF